jgi:hypothetical protein
MAEPIIEPATIVIESNSDKSAFNPIDPAASLAASAMSTLLPFLLLVDLTGKSDLAHHQAALDNPTTGGN